MSSQGPKPWPPPVPPVTPSQSDALRATTGPQQGFPGFADTFSLKDYVNNAGWKFWAIYLIALAAVGGFAVLAIGEPSTSNDNYRPSPASSQRAWLSPNPNGDNCRWVTGNASDYGDSWSFCNYPAP